MAKLSSMKLRKDYGERQIKCLIIEDYTTGELLKYYNPKDFERLIATTDSMFLTKVYSPNQRDKEEIFSMLEGGVQVEGQNAKVEITDSIMVINLFKHFTDVEIDVDDTETINEILENPNELFLAIKIELDKVLMSILETYVSTYKTLQANPQTMEILGDKAKAKLVQKKKMERDQKIKELEKEISKLVEDNA